MQRSVLYQMNTSPHTVPHANDAGNQLPRYGYTVDPIVPAARKRTSIVDGIMGPRRSNCQKHSALLSDADDNGDAIVS